MSPQVITVIVLGITVALFMWGRWPVEIVAVSSALLLYATGIINLSEFTAGFGDSAVVMIAALFVVSDGLDASGLTTWAGQQLVRLSEGRPRRLLVWTMALSALLTSLLNLNGAVAALLPMTVILALKSKLLPSQLLMPMAFAGSAGSLLLLTGSPVNLLIAEAAGDAGVGRFSFAEFGLVGVPTVLLSMGVITLLAYRLLPARKSASNVPNLSGHGRTLASEYDLQATGTHLFTASTGYTEVIVPPRSSFEGRLVTVGQPLFDDELLLVALQRQGKLVKTAEVELRVGDTLLVSGAWRDIDRHAQDADVLVVDSPELVRRQGVALGQHWRRAVAILVAMVAAMASGLVPVVIVALLAAGAMILLKVVDVHKAYARISWSTVLLVAGMIPMSTAMRKTGLADSIASGVVWLVGQSGSLVMLTILFIATVVLGQLISNVATALVMIPVALAASSQLAISPKPVLMMLCVASAAAFLTPVATPGNMMIMGPAGYRFGDYWKLGLPMVLVFYVAGVLIVPLVWHF